MNWAAANTWAAGLSFTDGVNTYDNWRLPATSQPDASCGIQNWGDSYGYNCTGSEMGHLFYSKLGGTAGQPILTSGDADLAKFSNLDAYDYWSATEDAPAPYTENAWFFDFFGGGQAIDAKGNGLNAWAVSPGDVGVPAVPLPAAAWLLGSGLLGLIGVARRRG